MFNKQPNDWARVNPQSDDGYVKKNFKPQWLTVYMIYRNQQSVSSQIAEDERDGEIAAMRTHIQSLERQLTEKDEQIKELQGQLGEASHRHDTVVMQMTRLLEYHQQPFWRKLFSRKALPPPEQIMDMETGGDKAKE